MRLSRILSSLRRRIGETLLPDRDLLSRYLVFGDRSRLRIHPTAVLNNALVNVIGGSVTIERDVFFGHHVSILTGKHDYMTFGSERLLTAPTSGQDVVIGEGAWVATNATVVGPCRIGVHAVVGACSLVLEDVAPYTMVAGVPARVVRILSPGPPS